MGLFGGLLSDITSLLNYTMWFHLGPTFSIALHDYIARASSYTLSRASVMNDVRAVDTKCPRDFPVAVIRHISALQQTYKKTLKQQIPHYECTLFML